MSTADDFYSQVGARITAERSGKFTQAELAVIVGLSRTSIANIERGRQQILLHHLVQIASALEIDPSSLLPRTPFPDSGVIDDLVENLPTQHRDAILSSLSPSSKRPTRE